MKNALSKEVNLKPRKNDCWRSITSNNKTKFFLFLKLTDKKNKL